MRYGGFSLHAVVRRSSRPAHVVAVTHRRTSPGAPVRRHVGSTAVPLRPQQYDGLSLHLAVRRSPRWAGGRSNSLSYAGVPAWHVVVRALGVGHRSRTAPAGTPQCDGSFPAGTCTSTAVARRPVAVRRSVGTPESASGWSYDDGATGMRSRYDSLPRRLSWCGPTGTSSYCGVRGRQGGRSTRAWLLRPGAAVPQPRAVRRSPCPPVVVRRFLLARRRTATLAASRPVMPPSALAGTACSRPAPRRTPGVVVGTC
jgi:hypothetical protein